MNVYASMLVGLGLSADAFAVSVTSGMALGRPRIADALRVAVFFGLFQALMPTIGWFAGTGVKEVIGELDHWVAFVLLAVVGCKMIDEGLSTGECDPTPADPARFTNLWVLTALAVATSIDALAVGVSFSFFLTSIARCAAIIGLTTFTLSFAGVYLGDQCGRLFERRVSVIGGAILILVGLKISIGDLL